MNIERLRVFKKVAELKSFTRAAEELFMTQPAISKNIKLVEKFYGVNLFIRMGNQIELTDAGKKLLQFANDILELADEAKETLTDNKSQAEEKIVLGAGSTVGVYLLPQLLEQFVRRYPNIDFTIEISNAKQVLDKVTEGSIEVGVVGAIVRRPNLEYVPLMSEKLQLIVSNQHPWARQGKVAAKKLCQQPFFLREKGSGLRYLVEERLHKAGIQLEHVTELPNNEAILRLVEAGLGVSIMSENVIAQDLELNRVQTVQIEGMQLDHNFYMIYRKENVSGSLKKFIRFINEDIYTLNGSGNINGLV
ncbi:selenium metabolism-associated LysR family transcriptional regulator [Desulfofalx alkaliphila]|uniref:selenium metabolism-associated LysR family transcriptional regulator n=1 Tax=Desulfofalx alkaliphila TaxID=105483 RepID=UPI0004E12B6D|nr:selenium metabolism-associated LysR family transcriptional regulator [Desulfofalx alkaliphila]